MLKLFSEKIRSIIPAGKKRVVPQQQSTEEHSVVTDSNTKIKNNDETSNIFIAIIFIVTLFLFATTFYITYTTGKEIQRTILDNFFGFLCNAYASSWIVNTAATILVLYMVGKWQGWQFHPLTAANHIATWGGIGGAFGLIVSGLSMFSAGNLIPSANISSLCTPSTLIDATTIGALIGSVFALPSYSFSLLQQRYSHMDKAFRPTNSIRHLPGHHAIHISERIPPKNDLFQLSQSRSCSAEGTS